MKKVISAVTAMTLLSTGAFAFDTINDKLVVKKGEGTVATEAKNWLPEAGNYVEGKYKFTTTAYNGTDAADLKVSDNQLGDALIYPAFNFNEAGDLGTEIVVRNVKNVATVAKVVLYAQTDSRELVDFNVYLSANDVFRFQINPNGTISTKDGSIMKIAANPMSNNDDKDTVQNPHKSEYVIKNTKLDTNGNPVTSDLKVAEEAGYVAVFAMAQSNKDYHKKHKELFKDYRALLDNTRNGWRTAWQPSGLTNGIMTTASEVESPNIKSPQNLTAAQSTAYNEVVTFTSPAKDTLTGSVRIYGGKGNAARDMLLPATALENFTDDAQMLLWAEAEYAAIQDRRIAQDGAKVKYDAAKIKKDSEAFLKSQVYYNFVNSDNELAVNKLVFTQPYKRILVQLDRAGYGEYWHATQQTGQVAPYGVFKLGASLFSEDEDTLANQTVTTEYKPGFWTSPGTTDPGQITTTKHYDYSFEVEAIVDFQKRFLTQMESNNGVTSASVNTLKSALGGYAFIQFTKADDTPLKVPAIVTQMTASVVDGKPLVNWVYAPTVK